MSSGGLSQFGVSNSFVDRRSAITITHGILHNARQQRADARAEKKATDIETASVSTFSSDATLTKEPTKSKNGTVFSVQDLKNKALKSQIRIGI